MQVPRSPFACYLIKIDEDDATLTRWSNDMIESCDVAKRLATTTFVRMYSLIATSTCDEFEAQSRTISGEALTLVDD